MNEERQRKLKYLSRCSFQPGSWAKRFVRDMNTRLDDEITIKQAYHIDKLYWNYRRQIEAMSGDDKPEIFQPGAFMDDEPIDTLADAIAAVDRKNKRQQRKVEEAQRRMDEWNAKVREK